jgi:Cation transport ATPase
VQIGNELLVKPGELFPVDGVMIEGATSADESALTGESIPVVKQIGDAVSGGTLNLDGQSVIRATHRLGESALSRILGLIEMAQQQKRRRNVSQTTLADTTRGLRFRWPRLCLSSCS